MPWQGEGVSEQEIAFRKEIEARKDRMLAERLRVHHPVMLTAGEIAQTKRNIETVDWVKAWFDNHKRIADYCVAQPDEWIERMLPELTPGFRYAFTCPNCVGEKSQEAAGRPNWNYRDPDKCSCLRCGHVYPSGECPETATLACPRSGQTFSYYLNDDERAHPEDHTGKYAYH